MKKNISYKTIDGKKIYGTLEQNKSAKGVVLLLHGITVDRDEYLDFLKDAALFLSENQIDSLRIDFRGHGKSGISSKDLTITGQCLDVVGAVDYLQTIYDISKTPLSIVAVSFGATAAIFLGNEYKSKINHIGLLAPVLDYRQVFLEPVTEWAKSSFNAENLKRMKENGYLLLDDSFAMSVNLIYEMKLIKPTALLDGIRCPITIFHGADDTMVPYLTSEKVAEMFPNIRLLEFEGMDHGFMDVNDPDGDAPRSLENKKAIFEEFYKLSCGNQIA